MIKVFFDNKPLKTGHSIRGVGSYTRSLLEMLSRHQDVKLVESETAADVVHYPYFDLFFNTLKLSDKPTIVTIFDVIPLIYPDSYPPGIKGKINFLLQKGKLSKVSAVITISGTSRKDIVRFLDVPQEKIFPIHLAPGPKFRKMENGKWGTGIRKKYNLPIQFILYVGDVNYNKNVLGLVKACKLIKTPLVIVGKQAAQSEFDKEHIENQPLVQLLEECGDDPNVVRLGFVPEEDLVKIYNLATVYCQPSFYEGFGLPVMEAMACGTLVAASQTQSLVEIAEGKALFFNPHDPVDIAAALKNAFNSKSLRNKLNQDGLDYVKSLSWAKVAQETIGVYHQSKENHGFIRG